MIKKALQYIAIQFGNPHGVAGWVATAIMNRLNQKPYQSVIENLQLKDNEKTLDIGFGNGYLVRFLHKKHPSSLLYGIDISEDMLKTAQKRNKKGILISKIILSIGDVMQLSFENEFFDSIYTVNTLYFWNDPNKSLQEIYRVMKPEATFLMVGNTKQWLDKLPITKYNFKKYEIGEIESLLINNGFTLIENRSLVKNKSYCLIIKKNQLK